MAVPELVRLKMTPARDAGTGETFCAVDVRGAATNETVFFGSVKTVATWLKTNGYDYVTGSNGIWGRA